MKFLPPILALFATPSYANVTMSTQSVSLTLIGIFSIIIAVTVYLIIIHNRDRQDSNNSNNALKILAEKHAYKLTQNDKEVKRSVALISHELRTTFSELKMLLDINSHTRITEETYNDLKGLVIRGLQELQELRYVGLSKSLLVNDANRSSVASTVTSAVNEFIKQDNSHFNPTNITINDVQPVASIPTLEVPLLKLAIVNYLRYVSSVLGDELSYVKINVGGQSVSNNDITYEIQIITPYMHLSQLRYDFKLTSSIIEKIGGSINFESSDVASTTKIRFTTKKTLLPAEILNESTDLISDSAVMRSLPIKTVVLAEDNPTITLASKVILESLEINVVTFDNGSDAYDYIVKHKDDPQLALLTDLYMPGLTGYELIKKLRAEQISVPIGVITAASEGDEYYQLSQDGANWILEKPLTRNKAVRVLSILAE